VTSAPKSPLGTALPYSVLPANSASGETVRGGAVATSSHRRKSPASSAAISASYRRASAESCERRRPELLLPVGLRSVYARWIIFQYILRYLASGLNTYSSPSSPVTVNRNREGGGGHSYGSWV